MKILIINGHQKHEFSKGELNFSLFNVMLNQLRNNKHEIQISSAENYNVIEERNKFFWADLVIFQFPIYWFAMPGKMKLYCDEVFEYNQFYSFSDKYGSGGLLKNKKYITSTTWNAPAYTFENDNEFFKGASVDEVLLPFHKMMEFCGLENLKTLSFHNVVKSPNYVEYEKQLTEFISGI